jgi:hypothetical protein
MLELTDRTQLVWVAERTPSARLRHPRVHPPNDMQFKIPQNVQREDKIVGPLTLKQLLYLGVGGGITYTLYVILAKEFFWTFWIWFVAPPAILTLSITFLKINGIPFFKWVFLMMEYIKNPKKRIFVMGGADTYSASIFAKKEVKAQNGKEESQEKFERDREKLKNIASISKNLDNFDANLPKAT